MLIEKITGRYYYDVVKSHILIPHNLKHTYAAVKRNLEDQPQGYSNLPEFFRIPERVVEDGKYCFNPQMEWTGGGFASTTKDLANWAWTYYNGDLFSDSLASQIIKLEVVTEANGTVEGFIQCYEEDTGVDPTA